MASQAAQVEVDDPLYNLRLSIKASATPILSTSAEPTPADYIDDLARATHITFNVDDAHRTFDLTSDTRFAPDSKPIDLRSCYFAWVNKDASVTDYFAAVTTLNEELPSGAGGSVQNLTFAQKIELIAWLSGETESSDSIAPIDSGAATAAAGDAAAIAGGKGVPVDRNMKSTQGGMVDARLLQIYDGERNMGDHNTILRGNKPIVGSPTLQAMSLNIKLTVPGLLSLPQDRCHILPQPPRLSQTLGTATCPGLQSNKEAAPKGPAHYSALSLRVLTSPHLKHQIVPR
jgi:parafibromin